MSDEANEADDSVGYKCPPRSTRFKKGQSGNPKGRPQGSFNPVTILYRELNTKVVVTENGVRKSIRKWDAAMKQLSNKSAAGDLKAVKLVMEVLRAVETISPSGNSQPAMAGQVDDRSSKYIVSEILRRGGGLK